jgi:hypothetical protein
MKNWKEDLKDSVAKMSEEEKERIITTLSRIKRTKYLEYLIDTFQAGPELANKIRSYYKIPNR